MPEVGEQAVRDVDHRRGAGARGFGPGRVRRLGHPVRVHHHGGRAEAALQHGEPGRGPPDPPADRHEVAGPSAAAGDRRRGPPGSRAPSRPARAARTRSRRRRPRRPLRTAPPPTARSRGPRASPRTCVAGHDRPTSRAVGTAPIAAMSARFAAAARRPICSGVDQSSRKCTVSTRTSVVATIRPSGAATTAASSPGPTRVDAGCTRPAVTRAIRPNSPRLARVCRRSPGADSRPMTMGSTGPPRVLFGVRLSYPLVRGCRGAGSRAMARLAVRRHPLTQHPLTPAVEGARRGACVHPRPDRGRPGGRGRQGDR